MRDRLRQLFGRGYDPSRELGELYEDLRKIESLSVMVDTQGWVDLKEWMVGRVVQIDASIVSLSNNPTKHHDEILHKHAFRSAMLNVLRAVDTSLSLRDKTLDKIQHYEQWEATVGHQSVPTGN